MITQVSDYTNTEEFYRVPAPAGGAELVELKSSIAEGERQFLDTFGVTEQSLTQEQKEAVKFFVFAFWLKSQALKKTATGASVRLRFTQSDNTFDYPRYATAWNRACIIMGQPKKKIHKIFNF